MSSEIVAEGKTHAELKHLCAKALAAGGNVFWPKVVVALLARIYKLEREMQSLRQQELFAPPSTPVNRRPVHE
jgi:hypothetical protein